MNLQEAGIRFDIDPQRLDEEWLGHSQMVYNAGARVADAEKEFDDAKAILNQMRADIANQVRGNPAEYGCVKTTEQIVEDAVLSQPEHRAAVKRVNAANYALGMAKAASLALEHRKRALTLLVELWEREYFSDPSPRAISKEGSRFDQQATMGRIQRRRREDAGEDNEQ